MRRKDTLRTHFLTSLFFYLKNLFEQALDTQNSGAA